MPANPRKPDDPAGIVRGWLTGLGATLAYHRTDTSECPVLAWAGSGAMALTGFADGPPDLSPASAYGLLGAALRTVGDLTEAVGIRVEPDPATVLGRRAAWSGYERAGRRSAGGATRLLPTADGWCAITLSRPDDIAAVPAIVGGAGGDEPWDALTRAAATTPAVELSDRAQLLGVPGAALPPRAADGVARAPWRMTRIAERAHLSRLPGCLVVDLSAMWAGPLAARILGLAGAHVVKVESPQRPDGARADRRFFDWLHAGHELRSVDFRSAAGRRELAALLDRADIVLEASRPRALAALGLAPGQRAHRPGQIWLGLTGYGRAEPMRVAFGDDAAVAGGLVGWTASGPVFCADAVADPLSGVCAALAVLAAFTAGGGVLIDLSMRDTAAAFAAGPPPDHGPHRLIRTAVGWSVRCAAGGRCEPVLPPRVTEPAGRHRAPWLGTADPVAPC
ncbi:CoA transferase [Nocardia sp. X0981]